MKETTNTNPEQELTGLTRFDAAKHAIEAATSLDEVKDIRDRAEACRVYAKQAHLSLQMQNQCAEIKIRAERRAGEILKEMEKNRGGWDNRASSPDTMSGQDKPPRYYDLGISYKQSSRWQKIASIEEEVVKEYIKQTVENKKELTSSGLNHAAKNYNRKQYYEAIKQKISKAKSLPKEESGIYCADCVEYMRNNVKPLSVDLTVTSPPIGYSKDFPKQLMEHYPPVGYVSKSNEWPWVSHPLDIQSVASELFRVTRQGGVVVWVVDNLFIANTETWGPFSEPLVFLECGFRLWDTMIHQRPCTSHPSSGRYGQAFEYMFVFSKERPRTFNPIYDVGKPQESGSRGKATGHKKDESEEGPETRPSENKGKMRSNIWFYDTGRRPDDDFVIAHPAPFSEALARDHILSWSNPGDMVFDPFVGSGTTCKMAKLLGRRYLGVDISEGYCELARRRIAATDNEPGIVP